MDQYRSKNLHRLDKALREAENQTISSDEMPDKSAADLGNPSRKSQSGNAVLLALVELAVIIGVIWLWITR